MFSQARIFKHEGKTVISDLVKAKDGYCHYMFRLAGTSKWFRTLEEVA